MDHSFDPGFFFQMDAHYQKEGGVIIVWNSASGFAIPSIKMQHIDSSGIKQCGPLGVVVENTEFLISAPKSIYDSENDFTYVFYQSRYIDTSTYYQCLKGQKISSDGNLLWGDTGFSANSYSTYDYYPSALSIHPDNSILITYTECFTQYKHTDRAYKACESRAFRLTGDAQYIWTPNQIIVSDTLDSKCDYQITSYIEGQWILAWSENRKNPNTPFDINGIYAQNINEDGSLGPLHIFENQKLTDNKLNIWPNPSSGEVTISFSLESSSYVSYSIYNMHGHKVKSAIPILCNTGNNTIFFNSEDLKPGAYTVVLSDGKAIFSSSIVVN